MAAAKPRVVLLLPVNFLRNYACFQYLADALHGRDFAVEVFAPIPRHMLPETQACAYPVHSCYEGLLGRIPRVRHAVFRARMRRAIERNCDAVIVGTTGPVDLLRQAMAFKRRHPRNVLVEYAAELGRPDEPVAFATDNLEPYDRCASAPDMVIDVEPHRAAIRKERLRIPGDVFVIPNTLPKAAMPPRAPPGALARIAGVRLPHDKRVVLFTGPLTGTTIAELKAMMPATSDRVFLLWMATGSDASIEDGRRALAETVAQDRFHICNGVPRPTLLAAIHEAHAGLVVYSYRSYPTENQQYAAPGKLYEYIAAGLPVVSYGNPSIRAVVDEYDLGSCAAEDTPESLSRAIDALLDRPDFASLRRHVETVFAEQLCYEERSRETLDRMCALIGRAAGG